MNAENEITEVRAAHRFDESALADYLRANIKRLFREAEGWTVPIRAVQPHIPAVVLWEDICSAEKTSRETPSLSTRGRP